MLSDLDISSSSDEDMFVDLSNPEATTVDFPISLLLETTLFLNMSLLVMSIPLVTSKHTSSDGYTSSNKHASIDEHASSYSSSDMNSHHSSSLS